MRTHGRILTFLTVLALAVPAAATAKPPATIAPPGDSAVSQYVEDVPTDQGGSPSHPGGPGHGGALPPRLGRRLDRLGADGRTLAAVVSATAPAPARAGGGGGGSASAPAAAGSGTHGAAGTNRAGGRRGGSSAAGTDGAGAANGPAASARGTDGGGLTASAGDSPAALLAGAATGGGSGGVGLLLPVMMFATAMAAVAWSVRRRRTGA